MLIPAVWGGTVLVAFAGGLYVGGYWNEAGHSLETIAEQKKEIRIDGERDDVSNAAGTQAVAVQEKIRTVFKDRIIYRDREVPYEVTLRTDRGCVIPKYFVSMWNSANQGAVPDAAGGIDESASDVGLTDVERQKELESEVCIANTEQLIGLQDWVAQQLAVK
ncbi:hypothetical protein [Nitrosospira sp. Nsp2]|uniref:hypothetical protein n=1 Tax=Nitrosospira sp. Nsp2 TaxID=136548 RepID=UPI0011B20E27|nr:hypothetical protein [Nitrosospira sp. Nsp2]